MEKNFQFSLWIRFSEKSAAELILKAEEQEISSGEVEEGRLAFLRL